MVAFPVVMELLSKARILDNWAVIDFIISKSYSRVTLFLNNTLTFSPNSFYFLFLSNFFISFHFLFLLVHNFRIIRFVYFQSYSSPLSARSPTTLFPRVFSRSFYMHLKNERDFICIH